MIQSTAPQDGAAGLVPHPHRLTLHGAPADAKFPPLCPNCGGSASGTISYAKVFLRADDETASYVVTTATVPFCDACIAAHRTQESKPPLIETLTAGLASMHVVGAVFPALAALFLLHLALGDLFHGRLVTSLVELGLGTAAGLLAWGQGWAVWKDRARFRVPPQTEVTKSFDFSDNTAPTFEARRFTCTMRDGRFADAFRALNIDDEYQPQSARAVSERRRSNTLLWIFGALVALAIVWDFLKKLFG